ncbi:MAG: helix-turn-helix transcriptional regulator [Clostridia bacterium]|nr:helix-turn-helix transcriptional regulator [Clostridia bacterium]
MANSLKYYCTSGTKFYPQYCYSEHFNPNFKMDFHSHDIIEFMYSYNNSFIVEFLETDKTTIKKLHIPPKHYILINSNIFHRMVIKQENSIILNVELEPNSQHPLAFSLKKLYQISESFKDFIDSDMPTYVIKSYNKDIQLFNKIQQNLLILPSHDLLNNFSSSSIDQYLDIEYYTKKFFLQVSNNYKSLDFSNSKHITKIIEYVNQHIYDFDLSSSSIAKHFNLNPAYLSNLFKKNTKMNISSFINHKRILRAMQLISTTSIPLIEISAQVGYNSRQHFARNFKTFANCSPQEYRNRISSNDLKNYSKNDLYKTERIFID